MSSKNKKPAIEAREIVSRYYAVGAAEAGSHGLQIYADMEEVCTIAKRHHTLQERLCNGIADEKALKRAEKMGDTYEKKIASILKPYGIRCSFSGDPRGFTVKLHVDVKGFYNTFGGQETGYGVGVK